MTDKRPATKELAYYLTVFKIEGHETWRASMGGYAGAFSESLKTGNHPKVTAKKLYRIDRITGALEEL